MESRVTFTGVLASATFRLKAVTFTHFLLISNALISRFLPAGYIYYNLVFMATLLWTLHARESIDAVHAATVINISAIFMDIGCIAYDFGSSGDIWGKITVIMNLVVRPITVYFLYKELAARSDANDKAAAPAPQVTISTVHPTTDTNFQRPAAVY